MKTNIGISDANRSAVAKILNTVLSDEFLLYTKTRNFHWNVVGPDFGELHKFFEAQYEALDETMDSTAERARALGGKSLGTMTEFIKHSNLKEKPGVYPDSKKMLAELLSDHEEVICALRGYVDEVTNKYGDVGTGDFLTGLMEDHEKMAWMLRSYLE